MIYADHNATSPLRPEARAAMLAAFDLGPTNPSSVHTAGRAARAEIEKARTRLGGVIGSRAEDILFTSGGTESIALAVQGVALALDNKCTFIVSAIEHSAVSKAVGQVAQRTKTAYVKPDGTVDLTELEKRLSAWNHDTLGQPVLCLMLANNETGIIQPVREAAALIREAGGLTICDGVQGLGKVPVSVAMLGVDFLTISAHKFGGPQGVGALWHRAGAPLKALQLGGGQERSLRSGTENVAGIAGMAAAAEAAVRDLPNYQALATHRDAMEARLKSEAGIIVTGEDSPRLAGVSNFALKKFPAETQVMAMDLSGVQISAGSACSSGKVKRSTVLMAMGADDAVAESAIRLSFGWTSQPEDFTAAADAWLAAARRTVLKEKA